MANKIKEFHDAVVAFMAGYKPAPATPKLVSVPVQSGTLTYSGAAQSPTWSGYDSTQLTLGGTTSATNAGTYTATFTLKDGYTWADGTSNPKSVTWTIAKANGSVTLSITNNTIILKPGNTATFTVTTPSDGVLSVTSSNTSIVTASIEGTSVTVTAGTTTGTATITVSQTADTNYTAASQPYSVKCKTPALITDSWEIISTRSRNGTAGNYYDVGDYKEITLNGNIGDFLTLENETLRVFILHINYPMNGVPDNNIIWGGFHNADGTDVALCDSKFTPHFAYTDGSICFNMNHWGAVNYGGWKGSDFRYDILGATSTQPNGYGEKHTTSCVGYNATAATLKSPKANTLLAALPADFRNALRLWSHWLDAKGNKSNVEAGIEETIDAVTLLTEFEVQGARTYANEYEKNHQTQMDYYKNGNSKIKYNHASTSSAVQWWLASPTATNSFCAVYPDGSADYNYAYFAGCLAPAFKT